MIDNPVEISSDSHQSNEVLGAWGYSTGLKPELIETSRYRELLDVLDTWNDVPPDTPGIMSAAVVFRSSKGGWFILGSVKGTMIMTGTLTGITPKIDNDKWIGERGRDWLAQLTDIGSKTYIQLSLNQETLRSRNLAARIADWLAHPRAYSGVVNSPLVLPILTQFFSMKQVANGPLAKSLPS